MMVMIDFTLKELSETHWLISLWEMRSILFCTSTIGMSPHSSSTWEVKVDVIDHFVDLNGDDNDEDYSNDGEGDDHLLTVKENPN